MLRLYWGEMGRIRRQIKYEQPTLLPNVPPLTHRLAMMDRRIVEDNNRRPGQTKRKAV